MQQVSHKPPHMATDPLYNQPSKYNTDMCYISMNQLTHLTNIKKKKHFLCIYKAGLQMYNILRSI